MNIIETSGLSKRYGSTWALRECSLAVPAGHVAALVGPNGAGKTTLLKVAAGLAAPTGRRCWPGRWRPGPSGTPGRRASAGGRWTLAKLVLLAMAVAAAAGLFTLLMSWYYQPYFAAGNQTPQTPLFPGLFGLRGVAFAAWTLAAFAIGALAGMLIRRVVPAIAATLAVYAGLAFATGLYLRQHYLTPLVTGNPNVPGSAWIISQQWQTKGGQPASQSVLSQVLQGAPQLAGKGGVPKSFNVTQYLNQHGYTLWTSYQPGSRFWPFQWIEGGWLLALSVLLIAVTVWLVRRRAA